MSSSSAYYKLTDGLLVQNDAQISYSKFDWKNECTDINYLWLNLKC